MIRIPTPRALLAAAALTCTSLTVSAQAPEVTLTRLECGTQVINDISGRFTDTFAYPGQKLAVHL